MSPQRRTALVSVVAACVLISLKLVTGLATGSLGLVSEAVHSGTDLVAALLTLFAVGVSGRPADRMHPYGHGKAEHLAALGEAAILVLASLFISFQALRVLLGSIEPSVDPVWYAFLVVLAVMVIDASRMVVSVRASRRYGSPALASNALHFGSDLAGSTAVLFGLLLARAGWGEGDAVAALFVAALVMLAAARLMRGNIDVLMDRVPTDAERAARAAIAGMEPGIQLRRLQDAPGCRTPFRGRCDRRLAGCRGGAGPRRRGRRRGGRAERVAREPTWSSTWSRMRSTRPFASESSLRRSRFLACARCTTSGSSSVDGGLQVSLHLKLPRDMTLEEAHGVASEVEGAIAEAEPEVVSVQTHLEPLSEPEPGRTAVAEEDADRIRRIVAQHIGSAPREVRFLQTDDGRVAFLTLVLDPESTLAEAHSLASEVEEDIRRALPELADVSVHTEP